MTYPGETYNLSPMKRQEIDKERQLKDLQTRPNMVGPVQASRQILLDAGFSGVIVAKAVRRLTEALDSERIRLAVSNGVVVGSKSSPDWDSRLKACGLVFNLAGCGKVDTDSKTASVNVQIINYNEDRIT